MGLSIALLAPKKGASSDEEEVPVSKSSVDTGSEKKFAMLAVQAIKDGDDDAAADALVSMVKACVGKDY